MQENLETTVGELSVIKNTGPTLERDLIVPHAVVYLSSGFALGLIMGSFDKVLGSSAMKTVYALSCLVTGGNSYYLETHKKKTSSGKIIGFSEERKNHFFARDVCFMYGVGVGYSTGSSSLF